MTLIELIIVIVVSSILLAVGVPAFQNMVLDNRLATATNNLVGQLQLARSEAAKRGVNVTVDSAGDWATGWTVTAAGVATPIRQELGSGPGVDFTASAAAITFSNTGRLVGDPVTIRLCDKRTGSQGREVSISRTGRPSLTRGHACPAP